MLDNRIYTFLEVCRVMNYRQTAESLKMTQPAVTQHIQFLESFYECQLFTYKNRKLSKTPQAIELEKYAKRMLALNLSAKQILSAKEKVPIKIGATKTIGEYMLNQVLGRWIKEDRYTFEVYIDNTANLLKQLDAFKLDLLLLEGTIDKSKYGYKKIKKEELVGICSQKHPFSGKEIPIEESFQEKTFLRESGSGTRTVFEYFLKSEGYSSHAYSNQMIVSSNALIENIVQEDLGVSYVYEMIAKSNQHLATFRLKGIPMFHEFNYVFLNQEEAIPLIDYIEETRQSVGKATD